MIDKHQKYRDELMSMQLDYIEATRALKNSQNSISKTLYITQSINELVEEILLHFQEAKKHNELPREFTLLN